MTPALTVKTVSSRQDLSVLGYLLQGTEMSKQATLQQIRDHRIVAIVRDNNYDVALATARACLAGGLKCLEVALTTPDALEVIRTLQRETEDDVVIGAGTVLDAETARHAIFAGAQFLLSPSVDANVIALCSRYQVVSVPGAFTATEVVMALSAGADIVKIFPAEFAGPAYIKSIAAPLPHVAFMPSGGVSVDNIDTWFDAGAMSVGVGGHLTAGAKRGDFKAVTEMAGQFAAWAANRQVAR
jgi:2-dehydro-3-deoxyphosphogluconate aldolase/(4S)-4-hydroxy-2-oxoglutarate aldolase